jgi:hypothetical protein
MNAEVKIQGVAKDEFFVLVPSGKDPGRVMADTVDLLQTSGEEVLVAGPREGGFQIKLIMKEGTLSALWGAATNALEGLTIDSPSPK